MKKYSKIPGDSSRYLPHQGFREMHRRRLHGFDYQRRLTKYGLADKEFKP